MLNFFLLSQRYNLPDVVGFIPNFVDPDSQEPAAKQFDRAYIGGWRPLRGFKLNRTNMTLSYPGDPPMRPLAVAVLRGEKIYIYPHAWVLILQPSGAFEVSRMD